MDPLEESLKGANCTIKSTTTSLRSRCKQEWGSLKVAVTSPHLSDEGYTLYRVAVTDKRGGMIVQCAWRRFSDCEEVYTRLCHMQSGRDTATSPSASPVSPPIPSSLSNSSFSSTQRSPSGGTLFGGFASLSQTLNFIPSPFASQCALQARFSKVFAKTALSRFSKATIERRRAGIQEFLQFVIDEAAKESAEKARAHTQNPRHSRSRLSGTSEVSITSHSSVSLPSRATSEATSTASRVIRREASYLEMSNSYVFLSILGLVQAGPGSGYLMKMGDRKLGVRGTFKKRWFEVNPAFPFELVYSETRGSRRRKGQISLKSVQIIDQQSNRFPHSFCIAGSHLPRTYLLMAPSEETKVEWVQFLQDTVKRNRLLDCPEENRESPVLFEEEEELAAEQPAEQSAVPTLTLTDLLMEKTSRIFKPNNDEIRLRDYRVLCVVGIGSFGKVMKVMKNNKKDGSKEVFAMKVIEKEQVIKNKMVAHTISEKDILQGVEHPFVVRLHHSFQTRRQLIFVMDYLSGGELYFHLKREQKFAPNRAKIYAAEISLALAHLHGMDIIYRDLKSENLVLDNDGHVVLTDFGLAKVKRDHDSKAHTFCGTPEYMSPELVLKKGHGFEVDWWSLGILLFEMLTGSTPFIGRSLPEMYTAILTQKLVIPNSVPASASKVIPLLLERDPTARLSSVSKLQRQEFFQDLSFADVLTKRVPVPWKPECQDVINDTRYFASEFTKQV